MKKIFCLCLLFAFGVSCFSKNNSGDLFKYISKHYIDVDNKTNRFDIIDRIGDISVLNLKVGDNWVHLDYPMMTVSDNGYYFLSDRTFYFLGYDKSGNLKFSKPISGRGRGEVLNVGNMFIMNDTLMLYDLVAGRLLRYTDKGEFIGYDNKAEIKVSYLYKNSDSYLGLTVYGENESNNQGKHGNEKNRPQQNRPQNKPQNEKRPAQNGGNVQNANRGNVSNQEGHRTIGKNRPGSRARKRMREAAEAARRAQGN